MSYQSEKVLTCSTKILNLCKNKNFLSHLKWVLLFVDKALHWSSFWYCFYSHCSIFEIVFSIRGYDYFHKNISECETFYLFYFDWLCIHNSSISFSYICILTFKIRTFTEINQIILFEFSLIFNRELWREFCVFIANGSFYINIS